ncbi:MAG: PIN domain-containing protein [Ferrovibrio sp.]|uniref:tetratricopeptide repeat protein n=1 Tax=Ferrovibrio sp. TaxID=1917215 RepID=UPI00391C4EC9
MNIHQLQLPPPKNWQDFEEICRALAVRQYAANAKKNGRLGQQQKGTDIYFWSEDAPENVYGIQCKQKSQGGKLTRAEIDEEIAKADLFEPPLKHWIIATTSSKDVDIEEHVRVLSLARKQEDRFTVEIWHWEDITGLFDEEILEQWYPQFSSKTDKKLDMIMEMLRGGISEGPAQKPVDQNDIELQGQINLARDLMNDEQPQTALSIFDKLINTRWDKATPRARFRLLTNKGAAYLHLGKVKEAAQSFQAAAEFGADDPTATANVIHAHLLLDEWSLASETAVAAIERFPEDSNIGVLRILAAFHEDGITDPQSLVSESLQSDPSVLLVAARWYREKGDLNKAIAIFEKAAIAEPDNEAILGDLAPALLTEITKNPQKLHGRQLSLEDRTKIDRAIAILEVLWEKGRKAEAPQRYALHAYNLIVGLRFLGKLDDAWRRVEEVEKVAPNEPMTLFHKAAILLEQGKRSEAEKILDLVSNDELQIMGVRFEVLASVGRFQEALDLADKMLAIPDLQDRPSLIADRISLLWQTGKKDEARAEAEALINDKVEDVVGYAALCRIHGLEGNEDEAQGVAELGMQTEGYRTNPLSRLVLGMEAFEAHAWDVAADALGSLASPDTASVPLKRQLIALINANRRNEAVALIEAMSPEVANRPEYLRPAALLYNRIGRYDASLEKFSKLREVRPHDLESALMWLEVAEHRGRTDEIRQFLEGPLEFPNARPSELMALAHALDRNDYGERALAVGYMTLRKHWDVPIAHTAYCGLIFKNGSAEKAMPEPTIIGPNTVFGIADRAGHVSVRTIEADDAPIFSRNEISPDSFLAQKAIGRQVGDEIETSELEYFKRAQKITFIKHKYLHLFHESLGQFNILFPNEQGMVGLSIEESKPDSVIDQVRVLVERTSERAANVRQAYIEKNLPVSMVALMAGRYVVETWQWLAMQGTEMKVAAGTEVERNAALALLAPKPSLIFDTVTFWLIYAFGLLDAVEAVFGPAGLVQSSVDEMEGHEQKLQITAGREAMTMNAENGQLFRTVYTEEDTRAAYDHARAVLDAARQRAVIVPAVQKSPIQQKLADLGDKAPPSFFDLMAAANGSGRVLVSEDFMYRRLAEWGAGVKGVWLQPLVSVLRNAQEISPEKYQEVIYSIADAGHTFTSLDASTLYHAVASQKSMESFSRVVKMIAVPSIDLKATLSIAVEFLKKLWTSEQAHPTKEQFTSALLTAIRDARDVDVDYVIAVINMNVENSEELEKTLYKWRGGRGDAKRSTSDRN